MFRVQHWIIRGRRQQGGGEVASEETNHDPDPGKLPRYTLCDITKGSFSEQWALAHNSRQEVGGR